MAGHYPGILMTGHIGANTTKFAWPRWGRPQFDPTQTGLCKFAWVWSSLICWSEKIPQNSRQISRQSFSPENQKSLTNFCRSAGRILISRVEFGLVFLTYGGTSVWSSLLTIPPCREIGFGIFCLRRRAPDYSSNLCLPKI